MENPEQHPAEDDSGGAQPNGNNELEYRNVDEEAEYDERGEQGPDPDGPGPDESVSS